MSLDKKTKEHLKTIRLAVFDVDGVLTDGGLILGESGDEYKIFNVRDGQGLVMLKDSGCHIAVITARNSKIVSDRMQSLGIEYVYQGQKDKGTALTDLMQKLALKPEHVIYVGDDIIDLPAMRRCGLACAVADAHPLVKQQADFITGTNGGRGAVREVCEHIMDAQNTLQDALNKYLSD